MKLDRHSEWCTGLLPTEVLNLMYVCPYIVVFLHREENQLDDTEWFIASVICSTRFGHLYAHHQELRTILVLLPHVVHNALVAGGWRSGAGQQDMRPG